jgi:hypothetical protein
VARRTTWRAPESRRFPITVKNARGTPPGAPLPLPSAVHHNVLKSCRTAKLPSALLSLQGHVPPGSTIPPMCAARVDAASASGASWREPQGLCGRPERTSSPGPGPARTKLGEPPGRQNAMNIKIQILQLSLDPGARPVAAGTASERRFQRWRPARTARCRCSPVELARWMSPERSEAPPRSRARGGRSTGISPSTLAHLGSGRNGEL